MNKAAYVAGRKAYNDNKTIDENPFDKVTNRIDHYQFREGWLIAHSEDQS